MCVVFDKNTSVGSVESGLGVGPCPVPSVPAQGVTSARIWVSTKQSLVQEQANDNSSPQASFHINVLFTGLILE